jgi:hypothetical protein
MGSGKRTGEARRRQEETMMTTFIPVQFGNTPGCYINLDLVKMVTPTNAGCIVHFDKGHTIGITTSAREIATIEASLKIEDDK